MSSLFIGEFKRVRISRRAGQLWKSTKISKTEEPGLDLVFVAGLVFVFTPDSHLWSECLFEEGASQSKLTWSGTTLPKEKLPVRVYPTMSLIQRFWIANVQDALGEQKPGASPLLSPITLQTHALWAGDWLWTMGPSWMWRSATSEN